MSTVLAITRLSTVQPDFQAQLKRMLAHEVGQDDSIAATVKAILADVRLRGDQAVLEYTARFDHLQVATAAALELPASELKAAHRGLSAQHRDALAGAAERIRVFHEAQRQSSW